MGYENRIWYNLLIDTSRLILKNGGRVDSSSFAGGGSGNIKIEADLIELSGINANSTDSSTIASSVDLINENTRELLEFLTENIPSVPSGLAGNVEINADLLKVTNGATIRGNNAGIGNGGNLQLNANSIFLDNAGGITASTLSGEGGNITINSDRIQLQNNSSISASAGGEGNGGNIDITADTIVALKDSDITATAFKGNGGNITITADGILGIEERKATPDNGTSDIDASSEFGEDGTVVITNPQTVIQDPIIAVREIDSTDPRDKSNNDCWNGNFDRRKRRLVYVGRGGFSPDPEDFNDGTDHYIAAPGFVAPEPEPEDWDIPVWQEGDPLIEANAVRVAQNGEVYLVAELESEKAKSLVCDVEKTEETEEEKATVTNRQSN